MFVISWYIARCITNSKRPCVGPVCLGFSLMGCAVTHVRRPRIQANWVYKGSAVTLKGTFWSMVFGSLPGELGEGVTKRVRGVLTAKQGSLQKVLSGLNEEVCFLGSHKRKCCFRSWGRIGLPLGHQLLVSLTAHCLGPVEEPPGARGSEGCPS